MFAKSLGKYHLWWLLVLLALAGCTQDPVDTVESSQEVTASTTTAEPVVTEAPSSTTSTTSEAPTTTSEAVEVAEPFVCEDPCHVVIDGDSLTKGLVERLCNKIVDLGACHNSGVSDDRVDQMIASAPTDVDVHLGTADNDLLFIWGGTNDLWFKHHDRDTQTNAEATVADLERYMADRRAAGWDYIVLINLPEMMDRVQGVDVLNPLLAESSADALIDLASDPELTLDNPNEFRNIDGVHFSRDGSRHIIDAHYIPMVESLRG